MHTNKNGYEYIICNCGYLYIKSTNQENFRKVELNKKILFIGSTNNIIIILTYDYELYCCKIEDFILFSNLKNLKLLKFTKKIIKISCGFNHVVLLTDELNNNIYGFGSNTSYQLENSGLGKINSIIKMNVLNKKIINILCMEDFTVWSTSDYSSNVFIRGRYKNKIYTRPKNIVCLNKVIGFVYVKNLYLITNEENNNLYVFVNETLKKCNFPKKIISLKGTSDSLLTHTENDEHYYGFSEPTFYKGNLTTDICTWVSLDEPIPLKFKNFDCTNVKYTIYKNPNINNEVYIEKNCNIVNNVEYSIYLLEPSGTLFSNYVSFDIDEVYSKNQEIIFKDGDKQTKLGLVDNGSGSYYSINNDKTIRINTLHFSSVIISTSLIILPTLPNIQVKKSTNKKILINIEEQLIFEFPNNKVSVKQNSNIINISGFAIGTHIVKYGFSSYEKTFYITVLPNPIINIKKNIYVKNRKEIKIKYLVSNVENDYLIKIKSSNKNFIKIRQKYILIIDTEKVGKKIQIHFICDGYLIKKNIFFHY